MEQVSLQISRGETLAVVGESGCGKVDPGLPDHAAARTQRWSDPARWRGHHRRCPPRAAAHRRRMQIIFQDPFASLDPRRKVGDAVAEPMVVHKIGDGDELDSGWRVVRTVGLEQSHSRQFPHQFSGGQRQRICIARALALEPELVIADESVSALDVSIQAQVINLMMDLQDEMGLSYLFISHDLAVVERISHRVAVMYLGQIVEMGPERRSSRTLNTVYTRSCWPRSHRRSPQRQNRPLLTDEIPSPLWAAGEGPEQVVMNEVEPGHLVAAE